MIRDAIALACPRRLSSRTHFRHRHTLHGVEARAIIEP